MTTTTTTTTTTEAIVYHQTGRGFTHTDGTRCGRFDGFCQYHSTLVEAYRVDVNLNLDAGDEWGDELLAIASSIAEDVYDYDNRAGGFDGPCRRCENTGRIVDLYTGQVSEGACWECGAPDLTGHSDRNPQTQRSMSVGDVIVLTGRKLYDSGVSAGKVERHIAMSAEAVGFKVTLHEYVTAARVRALLDNAGDCCPGDLAGSAGLDIPSRERSETDGF